MAAAAVLFVSAPRWLAARYTGAAEVVSLAALLIPVAGAFQLFNGLQVVASAALRGLGDTRVPIAVYIAGFWVVGLPVGAWIGFGRGAGPVGLWWGLTAGLAIVAVLLVLRVKRSLAGELRSLTLDEASGGASVIIPTIDGAAATAQRV